MDRVSRGVSRGLNAFLDTLTSARASGHQVVCIQCHGRVSSESYLTTHAKGFKLDFCSRKCGHSYWYEYGQHQKTPPAVPQGAFGPQLRHTRRCVPPSAGPRTCRLPGCNKPCFVEGTRVHDYCGRSHAQQANAVAAGAVAGPQTYGSHSCHSVYGECKAVLGRVICICKPWERPRQSCLYWLCPGVPNEVREVSCQLQCIMKSAH